MKNQKYSYQIIEKEDEIEAYKDFTDSHPCSGIWHESGWLNFKKNSRQAEDGFIFTISENSKIILSGLMLITVKQQIIRYGYIPGGILYSKMDDELYHFFYQNIKNTAREKKLLFLQLDSNTPFEEGFNRILKKQEGHDFKVRLPIPSFTSMIDLNLSEEDILKQMKKKGRYNSRLAQKKGVVIKKAGLESIDTFYNLLVTTTERDGFRPNSREYYHRFVKDVPGTDFLLAVHENDIIAAGIFTYTKNQALYYYGASSNTKRNLMATYLLQWEAIKKGKQNGCRYYDFMGIADPDNPGDPLSGVTDFKLKFGGKTVRFSRSYAIYFHRVFYYLYKSALKLKKILFRAG